MSGQQILGGLLRRERPGARQMAGFLLPSGLAVSLVAVEAGKLAAFVIWDETRSIRRALAVTRECLGVCHEVWLVTSVTGAEERRHLLAEEVGIRVTCDDGLHHGVARPAANGRPAVKDLVMLLNDVERMELAGILGVSETPLTIAAAGQLKWGSAPFALRICEILGDRAGPALCYEHPTPEMILRAARPHSLLAPLVKP